MCAEVLQAFEAFLSAHRYKKGTHTPADITHTAFYNKKDTRNASYVIPADAHAEFMKLYRLAVKTGTRYGIVARHRITEPSPLTIDLDMRRAGTVEDLKGARLYRNTAQLVEQLTTRIVQIYADACGVDLHGCTAYVFERPAPVQKKPDVIADGLHLVFPELCAHPDVHLYARTLMLKDPAICTALQTHTTATNDIADIIDEAVLKNNGWFLHGSGKTDREPYAFTHLVEVSNTTAEFDADLCDLLDLTGLDGLTTTTARVRKAETLPRTMRTIKALTMVEDLRAPRDVDALTIADADAFAVFLAPVAKTTTAPLKRKDGTARASTATAHNTTDAETTARMNDILQYDAPAYSIDTRTDCIHVKPHHPRCLFDMSHTHTDAKSIVIVGPACATAKCLSAKHGTRRLTTAQHRALCDLLDIAPQAPTATAIKTRQRPAVEAPACIDALNAIAKTPDGTTWTHDHTHEDDHDRHNFYPDVSGAPMVILRHRGVFIYKHGEGQTYTRTKHRRTLLKAYPIHYIKEAEILQPTTPATETMDARYLDGDHIARLVRENTAVVIRSQLGTGKTTAMRRLIEQLPAGTSILYTAPRITFAQSILTDFQGYGFKLYSNVDDFTRAPRLIIQMESLHKLRTHYDVVILDEAESCLKQFSSSTMRRHLKDNIAQFERLLRHATKIVALDAFVLQRTFDTLTRIRPDVSPYYLNNTHAPHTRQAVEIAKEADFLSAVFREIRAGHKVAVSITQRKGAELCATIAKHFPAKVVKFYHSGQDDTTNNLRNFAADWKGADVIIYTPKITVGVNYDPADLCDVFHTQFVYLSAYGGVPRDIVQGLLRFRRMTSNRLFYHINAVPYTQPNCIAGFAENAGHLTAKADAAPFFVDLLSGFKMEGTPDTDAFKPERFIMRFDEAPAWFKAVHTWNRTEEGTSRFNVRNVFTALLRQAGFAVQEADDTDDDDADDTAPITKVKPDEMKFTEIPDITTAEAERIETMIHAGCATDLEKVQFMKYRMTQELDHIPEQHADAYFEQYKRHAGAWIHNVGREKFARKHPAKFLEFVRNIALNDARTNYKETTTEQFNRLPLMMRLMDLLGMRDSCSRHSWTTEQIDAWTPKVFELLNSKDVRRVLQIKDACRGKDIGKYVRAQLVQIFESWSGLTLKFDRTRIRKDGELAYVSVGVAEPRLCDLYDAVKVQTIVEFDD